MQWSLLLCLVGVAAAASARGGSVLDLTETAAFRQAGETAEKDDALLFVEFYAPWCSKCTKLEPVLEVISRKATSITWAKVDVTENKELGKEFGVTSYPLLMFLYKGRWSEYEGAANQDGLLGFAEKMSLPAVKVVTSVDQLVAITAAKEDADDENNGVAFVFCSGPKDKQPKKQDKSPAEVFVKAANALKQYGMFASTSTPDVVQLVCAASGQDQEKPNRPKTPSLAKLERGEPPILYDGAMDNAVLVERWMRLNNVPLLSRVEASNFGRLTGHQQLLVLGVVDEFATPPEELTALLQEYKSMARALPQRVRDDCNFGWLDARKWASFVEGFGIYAGDDLPQFVVLDEGAGVFYADSTLHTTEQAAQFVADVMDGKVRPQKNRYLADFVKRVKHRFIFYWPMSGIMLAPVLLIIWALFFSPDTSPPVEEEEEQEGAQTTRSKSD